MTAYIRNCHVAWSVLHIELARIPNRTNRALSHKMAGLYDKQALKNFEATPIFPRFVLPDLLIDANAC